MSDRPSYAARTPDSPLHAALMRVEQEGRTHGSEADRALLDALVAAPDDPRAARAREVLARRIAHPVDGEGHRTVQSFYDAMDLKPSRDYSTMAMPYALAERLEAHSRRGM